jgi:chromate transporter
MLIRSLARGTILRRHLESVPSVDRRSLLLAFLRASSLHVGAAATAASLRRDLVDSEILDAAEFDQAYAIARITPGTNLLAMYTLLGKQLGGWAGAAVALFIGALVPAAIATLVVVVYITYAGHVLVARAMQGARAGALAVLLWAVIRLLRPQIETHGTRGAILAAAALVAAFIVPLPQIALLLLGGGLGAAALRRKE